VDLGLGEPLDPTLGNPGYEVGHYELDLAYDPDRVWLDATVTLTATATASLSTVNVDFIGFDVEAVTVNGQPAAFARTERDMTIRPRTPLTAGEQFELSVLYQGEPKPFKSSSGVPAQLGWNISQYGTSYVVSEPDGARSWFPCNDVPSDKATYTFRITVPNGVVAAANGVLEDKVPQGQQTTWVWQMAEPMTTYLATVVIGDNQIVEDPVASAAAGIPIRNLLPSHPAQPLTEYDREALGQQGEMIAFFSQYLGHFPFDTYGVAFVPSAIGALEDQTLTVTGAIGLQNVLAHELAHQWFGDDVSPAHWQDVWLNEGFATYMEWLWDEHRGETTMAELAAFEYQQDVGLPPPGNPPPNDLFNRSVDGRGALTLYALRARIGDAAFLTTLRAWVDRFGGRSATTQDFIALAEETSGTDLTAFFQGWLYGVTMPELPAAPAPPGRSPTPVLSPS
jgi:aminopeptidase N